MIWGETPIILVQHPDISGDSFNFVRSQLAIFCHITFGCGGVGWGAAHRNDGLPGARNNLETAQIRWKSDTEVTLFDLQVQNMIFS